MQLSALSNRQKLLLLFIGADQKNIDPIRIMKGMFIFTQGTPSDWIENTDRYVFVPYNYGPCSFTIYDDLEILENLGYIQSEVIPERSWKIYSITQKGITESIAQ